MKTQRHQKYASSGRHHPRQRPQHVEEEIEDNSVMLERMRSASVDDHGGEQALLDRSVEWGPDEMQVAPGGSPDLAVNNTAHVQALSNDPRHTHSRQGYNSAWDVMKLDDKLGFTQEDGTLHMGFEGEQQRADERTPGTGLLPQTGVLGVADYRQMLLRDFNFSGVITKYAGRGGTPAQNKAQGEGAFIKDVISRYFPDLPSTDSKVHACTEISRNIWSYATVGEDCSGNSDIAEMQGLLYVFDKNIRESSDTNTPMDTEHYFIVPGTERWPTPIRVQRGDGRHGQATILTTRHLLATMSGQKPADESYLLIDKSPSMQRDEFSKLAKLIEAGGVDGRIALAGFDDNTNSLDKVRAGVPLSPRYAQHVLDEAGDHASDFMNFKGDPRTFPYAHDYEHLNLPSGGSREQGLANALKWVKSTNLSATTSMNRQLIVVTDEPDFKPDVLAELQTEARNRDIDVKVIYSFTKGEREFGSNDSKNYVVIDVMDMDPGQVQQFIIAQGERTGQLNWGAVGTAQNAEERKWSDL